MLSLLFHRWSKRFVWLAMLLTLSLVPAQLARTQQQGAPTDEAAQFAGISPALHIGVSVAFLGVVLLALPRTRRR